MRKISQARVEQMVKMLRTGLRSGCQCAGCEGWDICARAALDILGVPEREPEKGERNAH